MLLKCVEVLKWVVLQLVPLPTRQDLESVKEIILLTSLSQAKPPVLLAYVHKQVDLFIQCEGLKCVCFPYLVSKLSH